MNAQDDATAIRDEAFVGEQWRGAKVDQLIDQLIDLRRQMEDLDRTFASELAHVDQRLQASAHNLLHYVALRHNDLRDLQESLVHHGLSSLGRCEAHVLANLNAVLRNLYLLSGQTPRKMPQPPVTYHQSRSLIAKSTQRLFGENLNDRAAHIMVTMPTEAGDDYELVRELVKHGMNCMRINCAHDHEAKWAAMIENLRRAEREMGCTCRVMMDLAGPKLRTGPIQLGPRVLKWRPRRDSFGRVFAPARVWFYPAGAPHSSPPLADVSVPVIGALVGRMRVGDEVYLRDTRGRRRRIRMVDCTDGGVLGEATRTTYVAPGTKLFGRMKRGKRGEPETMTARVGELPPTEQSILLKAGDNLIVTGDPQPGRPAQFDDQQRLIARARIGCTMPAILSDVRVGEQILFDDGKIGGVIEKIEKDHMIVSITRARGHGARLRADKGINLPDSTLSLDALTEKDIRDLQFIVQHADVVAYSFVRSAKDVHHIQSELTRLGRLDMGIILKIENRQAFQQLPRLLLAAMRSSAAGVMIARGDLAVECGYQRLAELQEEILWMCEAAHMPVIWATQVLEGLAKRGMPSRAEVTDAAMSVRAECVMLNKGPHIVEAVRVLGEILQRMQDHQIKKRPMLRRLRLADDMRSTKA